MDQIGSLVTLLEGFPRANIVGIRRAVDLNQSVGEGQLLLRHRRTQVCQGVFLRAHEARHILGVIEGRQRVVQRQLRATIDLLEVTLRIHRLDDQAGIQIERDAAFRQADRRQPSLRVVGRRLEVGQRGAQFQQLRHRRAVHLLDALVAGIGIHLGQDGVAHHPVQEGPLSSARSPLVRTPVADDARLCGSV